MFKFNVFRYLRRKWIFGHRAVKVIKQINYLLHATEYNGLKSLPKRKERCNYLPQQKVNTEHNLLNLENLNKLNLFYKNSTWS